MLLMSSSSKVRNRKDFFATVVEACWLGMRRCPERIPFQDGIADDWYDQN